MSVRTEIPEYVHTGTGRKIRVTTSEDTTGHDTEIMGIGPTGTAIRFGKKAGVAANTENEIDCLFVGVTPGMYRIEIVNGRGTRTPPIVLFPDSDNEELFLIVREAPSLLYV